MHIYLHFHQAEKYNIQVFLNLVVMLREQPYIHPLIVQDSEKVVSGAGIEQDCLQSRVWFVTRPRDATKIVYGVQAI